jgi:hypothetical protein
MPVYRCADCSRPVAVLVNEGRQVVVRACSCTGAIVGELRATVRGHGGVKA